MCGQHEDAWTVCMENRIAIDWNTARIFSYNDSSICFKENGASGPKSCPGIMNMIALHIVDKGRHVRWAFRCTSCRMESVIWICLGIGHTLSNKINNEHSKQTKLDKWQPYTVTSP